MTSKYTYIISKVDEKNACERNGYMKCMRCFRGKRKEHRKGPFLKEWHEKLET